MRFGSFQCDEIGVKAAAEQLGIKYYTLADWRSQRKARGEGAFVGSGNKVMPLSEKDRRIKELEAELRETKRANDILIEACQSLIVCGHLRCLAKTFV